MSTSANADNTDNDAPVPCANDCGFWGRPSTANYCSACYKQKVGTIKKEEKAEIVREKTPNLVTAIQEDEEAKPVEVKIVKVEQGRSHGEGSIPVVLNKATKTESQAQPEEKPMQLNRMRCFHCRTKVGLTGTECRCGYVFCGIHRYPEEHACSFDFRSLAQSKVVQKTGAAMADKIQGERL